jgi:hypothetical protein
MRPYQLEQLAKDFDISFSSACAMRIRYIFHVIDDLNDYLDEQTNIMPESTIVDLCIEICNIRIYQQAAKKGRLKQGITDADIEAAREYPVEQLIEFNRGAALAFCHADKTPSLSLDRKRNRCHCFPCDKDFSAIDILIERDGLDFISAVKQLRGL